MPSAPPRSPATLASTVYDRLRTDTLVGELKPGHQLRIEFLGKRYHTGHIPLREALNRLSADGHRAIMQAAIDGDSKKAVRLLQAHVRFTADTMLKNGDALNATPPDAAKRRRA